MAKQSSPGFLERLSAPARRALENKGITTLKKLATFSEAEILQLHGMGKASIPALREALGEQTLSFRKMTKNEPGKAGTIDDYIRSFPKETQQKLEQVRTSIKKTAPLAEECISYGIPAFKLNGYQLVYFAGFKNHIGLYPAPVNNEAFKTELSAYKTGKGSVQFPLNQPLPLELVGRIVKFRATENDKRLLTKKTKKTVAVSPVRAPKSGDDKKIFAYLDKLDNQVGPMVQTIRRIIKKTVPLLDERIKWNAPSYHYKGLDLLTFGPQKDKKLLLVFHHPAITNIRSELLEGTFKDRRLLYFGGKQEIARNKKEFERILKEFTALAGVPVS